VTWLCRSNRAAELQRDLILREEQQCGDDESADEEDEKRAANGRHAHAAEVCKPGTGRLG
jgi:hypothetical protein